MEQAISSIVQTNMLLGQTLVKKGIITHFELNMALELQKHWKNEYLGEILQFMNVPQDEINKTLDYLNKRKKIGDILIDLELITPEELQHAMKEQKRIQSKMGIRTPLGILLVQMRLINYREYMTALSKHFVLPIISLEGYRIHPSLQDVLGKKFIFEHDILVLKNDGQKIKIALVSPTPSLMQEIRKSIPPHKEIVFCLAHPLEIESVHKRMLIPSL
jgi:hypothetical protein